MGRPVFLVDNLLSVTQYPNRVLTASEEQGNFKAWQVSTARRYARSMWTPITLAVDSWQRLDMGAVYGFDMLALDRGSNLGGFPITFRISNDNHATSIDVLDLTIPSGSAPAGLDDPFGAVTEEGAWLKRFDLQAARYLEFFIPNMGPGLRPEIVNLWIGKSWSPAGLERPYDDEPRQIVARRQISDAGYRGSTAPVAMATPTIGVQLDSYVAYDEARQFKSHFELGRPAWFVADSDHADRAYLIRNADDAAVSFRFETGYGYRQAVIRAIEHEPRRRA